MAAQEAEQLLQRMNDGQHNYQGSFIYERKDVFSTHYVWSRQTGTGQRLERFLQLNGAYLELFRENGEVRCVISPTENGHLMAQMLPEQGLKPGELARWYSLQVLGQSRVAGRPATVLLFAPRDAHRYPLELHLDEQTAVPLKSLLLNGQGQLLERFQFVTFAPGEVDAQEFSLEGRPCSELPQPGVKGMLAGVVWQLDWLPDGFQAMHPQTHSPDPGQPQLSIQNYSDGLAHFSVFVEPLKDKNVAATHLQLGPTTVLTRQMETQQGTYMLTVLGEIPPETAQRLAHSVRIGE